MNSQADAYGVSSEGYKTVELTSFGDVTTVWRCPHTSVNTPGPGEEHFHQGTLMRLDGDAHTARRRALGALLASRGHAAFREKWLFPIAREAIEAMRRRPGDEGGARIELVSWARRVSQQLAAAVTGYDEATTPEGADRLFELSQVMLKGRPNAMRVTMGQVDEQDPDFVAGLAAKRKIIETFHNPALQRRVELLERVRRGEMQEDELPIDFLMLAAQKIDPAWNDPAQVERDALLLLGASVHTTTNSVVWALQEIFLWLGEHPDQRDRLKDEQFVLRAAQEALRLHPVVAGFTRLATEDITLPSGEELKKGEMGVMRSGPASADPEAFGETARDFDPDREASKATSRFGLAFGMGKHMCFGMPLVMGSTGLDGSLVYFLKLLLEADVRPDEERNAPFDVEGARGTFVQGRPEYHVVLPA